MSVKDSTFLNIYKDKIVDAMTTAHPDWDGDKVEKQVMKILLRDLKNPQAIADNNYTHQSSKTNLLTILDWAFDKEPIIAGNGTFYKQHAESENPNAEMVDGFLTDRKKYKKQMFAIEDELSHAYMALDLLQQNTKKLANSYYGASGAKTSPFYSEYSAIATTSSAQSVISTTETTFEAFLANNFVFIHFNECIEWIEQVLEYKKDEVLDDWIVRKSAKELAKRLSGKCLGITPDQDSFLQKYISNLTEEEITKLYWANNLIEFTHAHEEIQILHNKIFESILLVDEIDEEATESDIPKEYYDNFKDEKNPVKAYNKWVSYEKFYDPNNVPDTIKELLETLTSYYMKYVYIRFAYLDRIYQLKNFRRKVVTVIDTDSNILSLDTWMKYCLTNLVPSSCGLDRDDTVFVAINTITYIITSVVTNILEYYGECSNVEESIRPRYNMKNEFYFARLIIAKTKKRYLSIILLREGNRLKKPKYDVKGFDFKKASTSEAAEKVYMDLVKNDLLNSEKIDLEVVMNKLNAFKKEIERSIRASEITYLPNENAKELEAYKDPSTSQGVRGVLAWNACEPEKMIEFPAKVTIVKMNIRKPEDILPLREKNRELYERIIKTVFEDTTGIFIKPKRNSKGEKVPTCVGMTVLAIPTNEKIPEWALDYIDYRTIVNNVLAPFKSVTEIFNLPGIEEGVTGRKTTGISNIIRL